MTRRVLAALAAHEEALASIKPPYWAGEAWVRYRASIGRFRTGLARLRAAIGGAPPRQVWDRIGADPVTLPPAPGASA